MRRQSPTPAEIKGLIIFGVLFAAGVYLAIRFVAAIGEALILFSLVFLFTVILSPVVTWMERHKVPRYVAAVFLALVLVGVVMLVVWRAYPILRQQMVELVDVLPHYMSKIRNWPAEHMGFLGFKRQTSGGADIIQTLSKYGVSLARVGSYTLSALMVLTGMGIVFISTIYALAKPRQLIEGLLRLLGPSRAERAADMMRELSIQLRRWAYSVLAGMLAVFILTWIVLGPILHMPFALLFAAIAGLLEIVPTIGPILSAVPPAIVALGISPMLFVWVVVAFIIIQQIENHLIVPLILGGGVHLHPVSVVFAVTVFGLLFGILGVFLSVPAAVAIKVVLHELYVKPRELHTDELTRRIEPIISGCDEDL